MMLSEITARAGGHRRRRRVGRGESSGRGKTCTRGNKGCQSRSGGGTRPLHEGGQMPIFRRLPKRGFSNAPFRTTTEVVNISLLEATFDDGATVDVAALAQHGLVRGPEFAVKVLAKGTLSKKLTVEAHAFSAKAREAIEKAGGTVKLIAAQSAAEKAQAKRNTRKRAAAKAQQPPEPEPQPAE